MLLPNESYAHICSEIFLLKSFKKFRGTGWLSSPIMIKTPLFAGMTLPGSHGKESDLQMGFFTVFR